MEKEKKVLDKLRSDLVARDEELKNEQQRSTEVESKSLDLTEKLSDAQKRIEDLLSLEDESKEKDNLLKASQSHV